jgi:16S rRNA (cytosine967-C5)-methyltransferase
MKEFHRNIVEGVINALKQIFEEHNYADRVVERTLKSNSKWGSRDRRFIAETTYEVVRWHRLLKYLLDPEAESINDPWKIIGAWFALSGEPLPKWKEFEGIDPVQMKTTYETAKTIRKIRESVPDWMDKLCSDELGEIWDKEIAFLNDQANVVLRANTLKNKPRKLQSDLVNLGIETTILIDYSDALVLSKRQNILQLDQFHRGLFEVQDAGSQLIAPFLKVGEEMNVIDACAGAGGKALHLAALMKNTGKLISMDVEGRKLEELKKRADRAGVTNLHTRLIEEDTIKKLENTADRLLLDVPCSGLGVLRRTPDSKWKLTPDFIEKVKQTQQEILHDYSSMLRSGGLMVYATCSILPSENRGQIDQFLASGNDQFELQEERVVLPSEGFDGFYMARLKKK